jgi:hypothetical protein
MKDAEKLALGLQADLFCVRAGKITDPDEMGFQTLASAIY